MDIANPDPIRLSRWSNELQRNSSDPVTPRMSSGVLRAREKQPAPEKVVQPAEQKAIQASDRADGHL